MAPILSQWSSTTSDMLGTTPNSDMNFLIQTSSFATSLAAIYSASVVESVGEFRSVPDHSSALKLNRIQKIACYRFILKLWEEENESDNLFALEYAWSMLAMVVMTILVFHPFVSI
ncbi:hypothetical protein GQ457_10G012230 [Hibiscus cannabinus]